MADNSNVEIDNNELKKKKKSKKRKNKDNENEVVETLKIEEIVVENSIEKKKKKKKKSQVDESTEETKASKQVNRVLETINIENSNAAIKKKKATLEDTQNHYIIHDETSARTTSSIEAYRTQFEIRVYPEEEALSYKPILAFNELEPSLQSRCDYVLDYLKEKNFNKPSPIQVFLFFLFIFYIICK
jgi:hypothetical protein